MRSLETKQETNMATITKIDITEYLLDKYQLQKAEAKALVEDFFEEIRLSLESGGEVNYQVLVILNFVIKLPVQGVIQKQVKVSCFCAPCSGVQAGKNYVLAWKIPSQNK